MCSSEYAARPGTCWTRRSGGPRADAAYFFDDPAEAGRQLRAHRPRRAMRSCSRVRAASTSNGRSKSSLTPEAGTEPCCTGCFTKSCSISTRRSACFNTSTFRTAMASITALLLRCAGSVADPRLRRVSDRPAYSRGRAEIASEKSRHADHGRTADLRLDRGAHAAVGEPARCPPCGSRSPDW